MVGSIKKKIAVGVVMAGLLAPTVGVVPVWAADDDKDNACPAGCVATSLIDDGETSNDTDKNKCYCAKGEQAIFDILIFIVNVASGLVLTAAVMGIIVVGIQYLTARDNESQVAKAKSRLLQIIIGLFAYMLMWTFLQWLVPGGTINKALKDHDGSGVVDPGDGGGGGDDGGGDSGGGKPRPDGSEPGAPEKAKPAVGSETAIDDAADKTRQDEGGS